MSLYNLLFGVNQDADELLKMLDLAQEDFGRFRDAYLNENGTNIIVYTRCGGGNRDYYEEVFSKMEKHPEYVTNYDDDFDCTYAYFVFNVPEKFKKQAKLMSDKVKPKSIHEKFQEAVEDMDKKGKDSEYAKKMEPTINKIKEALGEGGDKNE